MTMTRDKFETEISKLNKSQQASLRSALKGRGVPAVFYVDEAISKVTVQFVYESGVQAAHHIMLGKRGRVVYHDIQKIA